MCIILYLQGPEETTPNLLNLIHTFSKKACWKINLKTLTLLYTIIEHAKKVEINLIYDSFKNEIN